MPLTHRNHDDDKDSDKERSRSASEARHATDRSPADEARDRSEQNRTAEIDRQRAIMRSPSDSLAFLDRHQEEVKKDEEERTKAFQESFRGKRIEAGQKKQKGAKDGESNEQESLPEEEAKKRSREALPPAIKEDGTVELPHGAALPPAVPEPRWPLAPAWAPPLADPPSEEDAETASTRSNRREHAKA